MQTKFCKSEQELSEMLFHLEVKLKMNHEKRGSEEGTLRVRTRAIVDEVSSEVSRF
jgi:hypothetical protein